MNEQDIYRQELEARYEKYVRPQSREEMVAMIEAAEKDYKAGRYYTHEEIKMRFKKKGVRLRIRTDHYLLF